MLTFGALYFNELSGIAIQDSFFNTMNKLKTIISPSFMNDLWIIYERLKVQVWIKCKIVLVVIDNWSLNQYVVIVNNLFVVSYNWKYILIGDGCWRRYFGDKFEITKITLSPTSLSLLVTFWVLKSFRWLNELNCNRCNLDCNRIIIIGSVQNPVKVIPKYFCSSW